MKIKRIIVTIVLAFVMCLNTIPVFAEEKTTSFAVSGEDIKNFNFTSLKSDDEFIQVTDNLQLPEEIYNMKNCHVTLDLSGMYFVDALSNYEYEFYMCETFLVYVDDNGENELGSFQSFWQDEIGQPETIEFDVNGDLQSMYFSSIYRFRGRNIEDNISTIGLGIDYEMNFNVKYNDDSNNTNTGQDTPSTSENENNTGNVGSLTDMKKAVLDAMTEYYSQNVINISDTNNKGLDKPIEEFTLVEICLVILVLINLAQGILKIIGGRSWSK